MRRIYSFTLIAVGLSAGLLLAQSDSDYQGWMKTVGATNGSLQKNIAAKDQAAASADAAKLQALLELSGPGGYVVLVGAAVRQAPRLSGLMEGIHFVGINPPSDMEELPTLSLAYANEKVPLRTAIARGVVVGADLATSPWLVEAHRVLLRGRRFVVENEEPELPIGLLKLAAEHGLWVGEKR